METKYSADQKIILLLFKDLSTTHTITSIAKYCGLSRVGTWKIVKKLASKEYLIEKKIGSGQRNVSVIKLNWQNILLEKLLSFFLTQEAVKQRRWRINFSLLEPQTRFILLYGSILYTPQKAKDIDIINVTKKNTFIEMQKSIDTIQKTETKKIHAINFTSSEFEQELRKPNEAILDAIKKGVVLFGQDRFIKWMKKIQTK
ncbi:hypothetical protein CL622_01140 [archaeon]|nr:hypothetical protein [archaeon]|tara:strand:+ start:839 stop:1441 length:603 start_codon:yes stop_codon:yes gene_type:complete